MTIVHLDRRSVWPPSGFTSAETFVECPKKAWLNSVHQNSSSAGSRVGTILHALLELYHTGKDTRSVRFEPQQAQWDLIEAERVFAAYQGAMARGVFGEVLGAELKVAGEPVEAAVGYAPYSATIDLACRLSERDCARLNAAHSLELSPGVWLVDHKSSSRGGGTFVEKQTANLQLQAYQLAWNASEYAASIGPAVGAIANALITTKVPQFYMLQVHAPSPVDKTSLAALWRRVRLEIANDPKAANPTSCYKFGNACHHLQQGLCSRS